MNKYLEQLKVKGYKINGDRAILSGVKFKIISGNIKTAMGVQKSYWLELEQLQNQDFKTMQEEKVIWILILVQKV